MNKLTTIGTVWWTDGQTEYIKYTSKTTKLLNSISLSCPSSGNPLLQSKGHNSREPSDKYSKYKKNS